MKTDEYEAFPYTYQGGGYFRFKHIPKMENTREGMAKFNKMRKDLERRGYPVLLHGNQAIEFVQNQTQNRNEESRKSKA